MAEITSAGAIIRGHYRYHLHRRWNPTLPPLVFVMLNPSTADETADDPTIRRCIGFAETLGFGGIDVVNLFAFRATKPADLRRAGWPVGPENDGWITAAAEQAVEAAGAVCCAWGAGADGLSRPQTVLRIIREAGAEPQCLERTKSGAPAHPLYLPGATRLRPLQAQGLTV